MLATITRYPNSDVRAASGAVTETVDIPKSPFLTVGGISGLVTSLLTITTFWWVTKPDAEQKRDLEMYGYRAKMLERALQVPTADGRRSSVKLLVETGLLELDGDALADVLKPGSKDTLPHWPAPGAAPTITPRSPADTRSGTDTARPGTGS
jgi:hypothetical protein